MKNRDIRYIEVKARIWRNLETGGFTVALDTEDPIDKRILLRTGPNRPKAFAKLERLFKRFGL